MGDPQPPERIQLYWCEGHLGIHIGTRSGEWNGMRLKPFEAVRSDLYDAEHHRANLLQEDRLRALKRAYDMTPECQTCDEAVADLIRQLREARRRADLAEDRVDKIIEWLRHADSCSPDKTISWEQAANKIAAHLLP